MNSRKSTKYKRHNNPKPFSNSYMTAIRNSQSKIDDTKVCPGIKTNSFHQSIFTKLTVLSDDRTEIESRIPWITIAKTCSNIRCNIYRCTGLNTKSIINFSSQHLPPCIRLNWVLLILAGCVGGIGLWVCPVAL